MFGIRRHGQSDEGSGASDAPSQVYVPLTVAVWREDEAWISQCLELDMTSYGPSPDESAARAVAAACSYLEALEEIGEREQVFALRSISTYCEPPDRLPLTGLPRELLEHDEIQVRAFEIPIGRCAPQSLIA